MGRVVVDLQAASVMVSAVCFGFGNLFQADLHPDRPRYSRAVGAGSEFGNVRNRRGVRVESAADLAAFEFPKYPDPVGCPFDFACASLRWGVAAGRS